MAKARLSTKDNPFNPFTEFDEWFAFDTDRGYNTCGYLARIAKTSSDVSNSINEAEIERAIDEIISLNINGLYVKVIKDEENTE